MFALGLIILAGGIFAVIRAWSFTISVSASLTGNQIINAGLVADREIWMLTGMTLVILGAIMAATDLIVSELKAGRPSKSTAPRSATNRAVQVQE